MAAGGGGGITSQPLRVNCSEATLGRWFNLEPPIEGSFENATFMEPGSTSICSTAISRESPLGEEPRGREDPSWGRPGIRNANALGSQRAVLTRTPSGSSLTTDTRPSKPTRPTKQTKLSKQTKPTSNKPDRANPPDQPNKPN